jgi:diketogulonate reductase-like aldo/keto reductase
MSPVWEKKKLRDFCKENGFVVTAFSPLGAKGTSWGTNHVMENEILMEIAKARGKTVAQVCLRWIYEQGVTLVMKSYKKERLKENLQIVDWELSEDYSKKISEIKQHRMMLKEELISARGPYKSIEEIWDGEL